DLQVGPRSQRRRSQPADLRSAGPVHISDPPEGRPLPPPHGPRGIGLASFRGAMPRDPHPSSGALAALVATGDAALAAAAFASRRASRDESFEGRVVLITGGSRGLGLAMARRFAREGARLALIARSATALDAAAQSLRNGYGVQVVTAVCDVRDDAQVRAKV